MTGTPPPTIQTPIVPRESGPRWRVVAGILAAVVAVGGIGYGVMVVSKRAAFRDRIDGMRAESQGVSVRELREWPDLWPTLTFPPRVPAEEKRLRVEYNALHDYTTATAVLPAPGGGELEAFHTYPGNGVTPGEPPATVALYAWSQSGPVTALVVMADGARYEAAVTARMDGGTGLALPTADLLRIIDAKAVEVHTDAGKVVLTPEHLARLRALASRLKG